MKTALVVHINLLFVALIHPSLSEEVGSWLGDLEVVIIL